MGLTLREVVVLSDNTIDLIQAVGAAIQPESEAGKKISLNEAVELLQKAADLAAQLTRDIFD